MLIYKKPIFLRLKQMRDSRMKKNKELFPSIVRPNPLVRVSFDHFLQDCV